MAPSAVFDLPGSITEAQYTEDASSGKYANSVMAVSTATADARPQSPVQLATDDGRPTYETRFSPSTSIVETATLTDHASKALAALASGANALTLTATVSAAPKLGVDFDLGDDVGFVLGSTEVDPRATFAPGYSDLFSDIFGTSTGMTKTLVNPNGRDSVPAFPQGFSGVARCYAVEMTLGVTPTITPILVSGA